MKKTLPIVFLVHILAIAVLINFFGCSKEYAGLFRSKQFLLDQVIIIKQNGDFEYILNDGLIFSGKIVEKNGLLTMKVKDGNSEIDHGEFKYDENKLISTKQIKGGKLDITVFDEDQIFMKQEKK